MNLIEQLPLSGKFTFDLYRKGRLIDHEDYTNAIVTVGKNKLLDVMFGAGTQITSWYMGLVNNAGFSAFSAADTMASHAGWSEATGYTESTRQQWSPGAASSGSVTNSSAVVFSINATATLYGAFITSVNTKSGTTGTLWSEGAFSSTKPVVNGDSVRLTYTVSC